MRKQEPGVTQSPLLQDQNVVFLATYKILLLTELVKLFCANLKTNVSVGLADRLPGNRVSAGAPINLEITHTRKSESRADLKIGTAL